MTLKISALPSEPLLKGEKALENAPQAELAGGRHCIPQHYLSYNHTLQSVEELVLDIEYDQRYPIFVSHDKGGIYIQIGVIGVDNYKKSPTKIVYGRKWRVEPQLPSSEIIQTVFLALKKAREHEVRELFRFVCAEKTTTPFNNHHDLPLLTNSRKRLQKSKNNNPLSHFNQQLEHLMSAVSYDGTQFELMGFTQRPSGHYLVELAILHNKEIQLIELKQNKYLSFILTKLDINHFLHQLMQQLIQLSDRHIDENFRYRSFNRFSWNNDIQAIAKISSEVRQLHKSESLKNFHQDWQQNNYETDRSRIPKASTSVLWERLNKQLEHFSPLKNTLPVCA